MLVFVGLWTQADKAGNFPWRPAQLKLDILPFVEYDLGSSLEALRKTGFIIPYTGADGKRYGHIPNFSEHQRFFGSEIKALPRFPAFSEQNKDKELPRDTQGSSLEVTRTVELGIRSNGDMDDGVVERVRAPRFTPPTLQEISDYCRERGNGIDPEKFRAYYESNGWKVGRNPMKSWKAAVTTWEKTTNGTNGRNPQQFKSAHERKEDRYRQALGIGKPPGNDSSPVDRVLHGMSPGGFLPGNLGG